MSAAGGKARRIGAAGPGPEPVAQIRRGCREPLRYVMKCHATRRIYASIRDPWPDSGGLGALGCRSTSGSVTKCHDPHAAQGMGDGRFGHEAVLIGRGFSIFRPVSPAWRLRHGVSFRAVFVPSSPPPPARLRRDPDSRVSRVRPCAGGRAFRAGAVCAPDCARGAGRSFPVSFPGVFLRRRRRQETKQPPDAASFFLANIAYDSRMSISS